MSVPRLDRKLSEETKMKAYAQYKAGILKANDDLKIGETVYLPTIKEVAAYIGIPSAILSKCLDKKRKGEGYYVTGA